MALLPRRSSSGEQQVPGVILKYRRAGWLTIGGLQRSSWVCARSVRLRTGHLGLADRRAPSGGVSPQNGCSLVAKRLGYRGVRFDLAEQTDQGVDVGGREGSICFRQVGLPHWLALEADVGGMALQAGEGAGNAFAGFWHGGAFLRLTIVLPIAQWRVDSAS